LTISALAVSVVIPTKGRRDALLAAVRSVAVQTLPAAEVVVIDGSQDAMPPGELSGALAGSPARLTYVWAPESTGLTHSRNRGIRMSRGEIVQFLDDDTTIEPGYLGYVAEAFADSRVGGVGGRIVDPTAAARFRLMFLRLFYTGEFRQRKEEYFIVPPRQLAPTNTLPGASAYRRAVVDRLAFDETITSTIGEDVEFSYRAARDWQLVIEPRAVMRHHRADGNRESRRHQFSEKVHFFHYHFRKNMAGTPRQWLSYFWLNAGLMVDVIRRLQPDPLLGACDGWARIWRTGLLSRPPQPKTGVRS